MEVPDSLDQSEARKLSRDMCGPIRVEYFLGGVKEEATERNSN